MDAKLDTLIEKLKTEGVEAARQQSDDIIENKQNQKPLNFKETLRLQ